MTPGGFFFATPERRFLTLAVLITALRVAALVAGDPNLGPDEAQYWFWSKAPDVGYYSKPPLIAWAIAATTALFGDAEWAVRLSAPFFQLGAGVVLFLAARRIADARAAFWAGVSWLTMPGVFLSAELITTDGPLLFFWSLALYGFIRLTADGEPRRFLWGALLGASIGLGLLSKYAMLFFLPGAALALLVAPARRRLLKAGPAALAALIAGALIAPNLVWNAENDFQTIAHTAANADWSGSFGHPDQLLKFLGDQFGVAGPILLLLMIAAGALACRGRDASDGDLRMLIAFSLPALLIVAAQAFISRAHANWAAVTYPSAVIAAAILAGRWRRGNLALKASLGLHLLAGAGFLLAFSSFALADAVGASGPFKRLRGWETLGPDIAARAQGYDAVLADDREVMSGLVYYARQGPPIVAWNPNGRIDNHYEAFAAFDPARDRRLLYVTTAPDAAPLGGAFTRVTPIGVSRARMTATRERTLYLFEISAYRDAAR
ncbi:MAG: ArnT family glycosyltransferase [Parvularculaceae bacterium]